MRMTRPRFTVRRMMIIVMVVAVNFGLIRGAEESGMMVFTAYTFVPSLSLLTVSAVHVGIGLVKHGKASSFLTGYLLLGGLASFGMCLDLATQESFIMAAMSSIARYTSSIVGPNFDDRAMFGNRFMDLMVIFTWSLPQIILAFIGGGLATRYKLMIVLGDRTLALDPAMTVMSEV